ENQVDAMVDKLADTHFLAVVGSSGSGKSSLVNCGLRPALARWLDGPRWHSLADGPVSAWQRSNQSNVPGAGPRERLVPRLPNGGVDANRDSRHHLAHEQAGADRHLRASEAGPGCQSAGGGGPV